MKNSLWCAAAGAMAFAGTMNAGFFDLWKSAPATNEAPPSTTPAANLSEDQMAGGLKDALGKGVQHAVASLGHENGFFTNISVKILLPEQLQKLEPALRAIGQGQVVDEFIESMNRAAEKAVPVAAAVFGDSIKQMTIADARSIVTGPNNAATEYFRRTTQTNLFAQFHPLVKKATDEVGATAKYKKMMAGFTSANTLGGFFGQGPINFNAADIDSYVTGKAMDGLFKMVAEEEKNIRANPVARTTDLLKKVFGSR